MSKQPAFEFEGQVSGGRLDPAVAVLIGNALRRLDGRKVLLTLREWTKPRSLAQNAYWFAVLEKHAVPVFREYASHALGVPFVPYGSRCPSNLGRLLVIDTARESGATLRKAARKYAGADPVVVACFEEPPRVAFWYEAAKPQRYRHEALTTGR